MLKNKKRYALWLTLTIMKFLALYIVLGFCVAFFFLGLFTYLELAKNSDFLLILLCVGGGMLAWVAYFNYRTK